MVTPGYRRSILFALSLLAMASALASFATVVADPPPTPEPTVGLPLTVDDLGSSPSYTGCGGVTAPIVNSDYEQQVVEQTNAERAANGLPPLKRAPVLDAAARYHSTDMGQDDYFDHDSYDRNAGNLVKTCDASARILSYYSGARTWGENIAAGYRTPQEVMTGWMNSSGHRSNILNSGFWELGVGYYQGGGSYGRYWTQDFGRRAGVYPVVVNGEAAKTDSRAVTLYIYGSWTEMRLRNDSEAWGAWQPFKSSLGWTLGGVAGEHTVSVEMRSGTQTGSSSDSIYLTTASPPATATPPATVCPDYNHNGAVDASDLFDVARRWRNPNQYDPARDLNGDGRIDVRDVEPVGTDWGTACR